MSCRSRAEELAGLPVLVEHDPVGDAPPELQRHARGRDLARVGDRAPRRPGLRHLARRAADLAPREQPKARADRAAPEAPARASAREPAEVAVLEGEVRDGVEGGRSGEELRIAADEQQRLLAAHAAAERVDLPAVDLQPGQGPLQDLRQAREIVDVPLVAPGVGGELAAVRVGIDDGELPPRRQVAPVGRVRLPGEAASVRRDDEGDRRVVALAVRAPGAARTPGFGGRRERGSG